jgi:hypothetical protein
MKWIGFFSCIILSLAVPAFAHSAQITTPADQFGFEPGADRKLADWTELTAYYILQLAAMDQGQFARLGDADLRKYAEFDSASQRFRIRNRATLSGRRHHSRSGYVA